MPHLSNPNQGVAVKTFYFIISALLIYAALNAAEPEQEILFPDHHLCLEASGKVVLKADKAVFSFETRGEGASLRAAVTKAKSNVEELVTNLTDLGIDRNCFSTGSFSSGKNQKSYFLTDKKDYVAVLVTTVTMRDLTKLDEAVLILTDKMADNLSGIKYSLDDPSAARQEAREIALNRIVKQRDTISRIMNIQITDVQLIDEAPFEALPWNNGITYYGEKYPGAFNTVVQTGIRDETISDPEAPENSGGFYSPDITVETQVRVIYRIGLAPGN